MIQTMTTTSTQQQDEASELGGGAFTNNTVAVEGKRNAWREFLGRRRTTYIHSRALESQTNTPNLQLNLTRKEL